MILESHDTNLRAVSDRPVADLSEYRGVDGAWRELGLSAPPRRALINAKLHKLEDLATVSGSELKSLHGMGPSTSRYLSRRWRPTGSHSGNRPRALRQDRLPDARTITRSSSPSRNFHRSTHASHAWVPAPWLKPSPTPLWWAGFSQTMRPHVTADQHTHESDSEVSFGDKRQLRRRPNSDMRRGPRPFRIRPNSDWSRLTDEVPRSESQVPRA